MAQVLVFDENTQVSLESQLQLLALEANSITNLIDVFKNIIPNLASRISEAKNTFIVNNSESDYSKNVQASYSKVESKLKHVQFTNVGNTLISVPEGFKGNFINYLKLLNKLSPALYSETNVILGEYNFVLSSFITNKEDKISLKDHTNLFQRAKLRREYFVKEITGFFPTDSSQSKTYLKNTIERFADIDAVVIESKRLDKVHNSQNIKAISESIQKTVQLLDIIIKNVESKGITNVSGNSAKNISEGAYEIGKLVEFIAVFRFKTDTILKSIESLLQTIDKLAA